MCGKYYILKLARIPCFYIGTKNVDSLTKGCSYSVSQSICSPLIARSTNGTAKLEDFNAMVTPDENTGSKNSPALPNKA